jgi:HEAT repeat protein
MSFWLLVMLAGPGRDPCIDVLAASQTARRECVVEELKKLGDRTVAMAAVQRLAGLAPDSIAPLRTVLRGKGSVVSRAGAADALGRIGPTHAEIASAVPDLVACLKDESPVVRRQAAGALGRIGKLAQSALPALALSEGDPDPMVRHLAAFSIRTIRQQK